jgi:ribose transport system permease protein
MILTGRVATALPNSGDGMEMDAIAAVVIGGTPMSGGKANVLGTIFG